MDWRETGRVWGCVVREEFFATRNYLEFSWLSLFLKVTVEIFYLKIPLFFKNLNFFLFILEKKFSIFFENLEFSYFFLNFPNFLNFQISKFKNLKIFLNPKNPLILNFYVKFESFNKEWPWHSMKKLTPILLINISYISHKLKQKKARVKFKANQMI